MDEDQSPSLKEDGTPNKIAARNGSPSKLPPVHKPDYTIETDASDDEDSDYPDEVVEGFTKDNLSGVRKPDPSKRYTLIKVPNRMGIRLNTNGMYYDDEAEKNYKKKKQQLMRCIKRDELLKEGVQLKKEEVVQPKAKKEKEDGPENGSATPTGKQEKIAAAKKLQTQLSGFSAISSLMRFTIHQ